jgi:predicted DNA-binding ribbon-helix-helix protein
MEVYVSTQGRSNTTKPTPRSLIKKHSTVVFGERTSISLEDAFWEAFKEIAQKKQMTVNALIELVSEIRGDHNLSSAIRLYILNHYKQQVQAAEASMMSDQAKKH